MMKYVLRAVLFAYFAAAFANSSVKPTTSAGANKAHCNVNNNYNSFYAGPNCKKIERQLAEMRNEIRALKRNETGGSVGIVYKQLAKMRNDILEEIKTLKRNNTGGSDGKVYEQLAKMRNDILEEIRTLKRTKTCGSYGKVYKNCAEVYKSGGKISGVYKIDPDGLGEFEVYCDQTTAGGGWTMFQKRLDGSVDFYRTWEDYKRGFGNLNGEFWLGLDKIHRLTVSNKYKLRVDLEDVPGNTAFAVYSSFSVTSERAKYQLNLGSYSGTAGDCLGYHRGMAFTTKDRDNDKRSSANCAVSCRGAWWYNACYYSNLNGPYSKTRGAGISWYRSFKKRTEMKIRPQNF